MLESSCGDGVFLESSAHRLIDLGAKKEEISNLVLGIEIDVEEATKAVMRLSKLGIQSPERVVFAGDFFEYSGLNLLGNRFFDAALGNPPFIRYQNLSEEIKKVAFGLMREAQLDPIGHTNIWVPFVIVSSLLLNEKGRLAMVVPAELFQVKYAAETRQFLSNYYNKLTIITFEKLIFQDALQEVVILLGEKNFGKNEGIRIIELKDIDDLIKNKNRISDISNQSFSKTQLKPLNHTTDKWIQYFLEENEILLLRELKGNCNIKTCGDFFEVDIGVVTGKNNYFLMSHVEATKRNLNPHLIPIVAGSAYLKGIRFSEADWSRSMNENALVYLFKPSNSDFGELPTEVNNYIRHGEETGIHRGYKCSIRSPWYRVSSTWKPDGFILRQVHEYPKMVLNETKATCTDTIHRIKFLNNKNSRKIIVAFLNSMTFAFSEVIGRSYGGGVLTLEPSEAEKLPIPINGIEKLDFDFIDSLVRYNGNIEDCLDINDKILLKNGLGLSQTKIDRLRNIWKKLRNRRLGRGCKK